MLGEILAKRWTETAIPVTVLIIVAFFLSGEIEGLLSPAALSDAARQAGEIGCVVLGMALVMIVGGIDLSVGSTFALTNFCALYVMNVLKWPVAGSGPDYVAVWRGAGRYQWCSHRLLPTPRLYNNSYHSYHLPISL